MANPFKRFARYVRRKLAGQQQAHVAPALQPQDEPEDEADDEPGDAPSGLPSLAQLPTDQELERHCAAYKSARHFHVTRGVNVPSILKQGLDPNQGGSATGTTATTGNVGLLESVQKKVHVGGDRATALYYERQLGGHQPERLRVFVEPEQKQELVDDLQDADNYAYWTTQHLQPNQLVSGRFSNQDVNALRSVFASAA